MILKHKKDGNEITINSKRGKPIISKCGLIAITKGTYDGMVKIAPEILEEFEVVA